MAYPEHILIKLRQRNGLSSIDTRDDYFFNKYQPSKAFEEVCNWEGLMNYSQTIKEWIKDIYGVNLDELES